MSKPIVSRNPLHIPVLLTLEEEALLRATLSAHGVSVNRWLGDQLHPIIARLATVNQDQRPNLRVGGKLHIVHCYVCGQDNYPAAVATGTCAMCGWRP